jgi:hypothetical protein
MQRKWHHHQRLASPARLVGKRAGALGKEGSTSFCEQKEAKKLFESGTTVVAATTHKSFTDDG